MYWFWNEDKDVFLDVRVFYPLATSNTANPTS